MAEAVGGLPRGMRGWRPAPRNAGLAASPTGSRIGGRRWVGGWRHRPLDPALAGEGGLAVGQMTVGVRR